VDCAAHRHPQRHIAAEGEFTSHLAIHAATCRHCQCRDRCAVDRSDRARDLDAGPHLSATAVEVQNALGINHGAAFDLQAVCSGFVFALATADNFLRTGAFKRALVIGAETFSRILDWSDRGTCVLFGRWRRRDRALKPSCSPASSSDRGILTTHLRSERPAQVKLYVDAVHPRPAPWAISGWRAAKCSSTPSA